MEIFGDLPCGRHEPVADRSGQLPLRHAQPGLAVIFGLLNVVNFAHGAMFMLGAMIALDGRPVPRAELLGHALFALVVFAIGIVIEKLFLKHLYKLDHLYGLLLTFGITLVVEGLLRTQYGVLRPVLQPSAPAARLHRSGLHGPAQLPRVGRLSHRSPSAWAPQAIIEKTASGALLQAPRHRESCWSKPSASTYPAWSPSPTASVGCCRRRRARRPRAAGQPPDGLQPHHRRLCRRRHRRHGLHLGRSSPAWPWA